MRLAYTLAVYALPFMLGILAAQFAYQTGAGFIGAGLVGFVAAIAAFGILALLFDTLRSPILRLIVALSSPLARRRCRLRTCPRRHQGGCAIRKPGGKSAAF